MILQEALEFKVYTTESYQLRRDAMKAMGWRCVLEGRSLKKEIQKGLDGKAHQRGSPPPQGTVKTGSRGSGRSTDLTQSTAASPWGNFALDSARHLRAWLAEDQYLCLRLSLVISCRFLFWKVKAQGTELSFKTCFCSEYKPSWVGKVSSLGSWAIFFFLLYIKGTSAGKAFKLGFSSKP